MLGGQRTGDRYSFPRLRLDIRHCCAKYNDTQPAKRFIGLVRSWIPRIALMKAVVLAPTDERFLGIVSIGEVGSCMARHGTRTVC